MQMQTTLDDDIQSNHSQHECMHTMTSARHRAHTVHPKTTLVNIRLWKYYQSGKENTTQGVSALSLPLKPD